MAMRKFAQKLSILKMMGAKTKKLDELKEKVEKAKTMSAKTELSRASIAIKEGGEEEGDEIEILDKKKKK